MNKVVQYMDHCHQIEMLRGILDLFVKQLGYLSTRNSACASGGYADRFKSVELFEPVLSSDVEQQADVSPYIQQTIARAQIGSGQVVIERHGPAYIRLFPSENVG